MTVTAGSSPRPHPLRTLVTGAAMGAADVVPGFSGGTVALVAGIYDRLIAGISGAAGLIPVLVRGRWRAVPDAVRALDVPFLATLLVGLVVAAATLAGPLERLLGEQPIVMSALFLGLVLGAAVIARHRLRVPVASHAALVAVAAVATAIVLGLRPTPTADPSLAFLALAGAIGISAMILPGVSGSFLLLLLGAYEPVIAAVAARDVTTLGVVAVGIVAGLALFARLLDRLLRRHHDRVLALLIGLMLGSARVLWPWPSGAGVGDPALAAPGAQVGAAATAGVGALAAVIVLDAVGRRIAAGR